MIGIFSFPVGNELVGKTAWGGGPLVVPYPLLRQAGMELLANAVEGRDRGSVGGQPMGEVGL